jgi:hypothetical protein
VYVACGVGISYMINPDPEICRASSLLCFFGSSVASIIYCFFCLLETKGRTFAVIDLLFFQETKTRYFKTYMIRMVWRIFLLKPGVTLLTLGG